MTNIEDFNYDLPDSHIARYPATLSLSFSFCDPGGITLTHFPKDLFIAS